MRSSSQRPYKGVNVQRNFYLLHFVARNALLVHQFLLYLHALVACCLQHILLCWLAQTKCLFCSVLSLVPLFSKAFIALSLLPVAHLLSWFSRAL